MKKTFFEKEKWQAKIETLKQSSCAPAWLIDAMLTLTHHAEKFPLEENKDRVNVSFIYPH